MLPIHSHLTITDFNALMFNFLFDVFLTMIFMRSLDWYETLVSVWNFVQISFRFWAGEAIWETAVGTWKGFLTLSTIRAVTNIKNILPCVTSLVTGGSDESFLSAGFFLKCLGCVENWLRESREQKMLLFPASFRQESSRFELTFAL